MTAPSKEDRRVNTGSGPVTFCIRSIRTPIIHVDSPRYYNPLPCLFVCNHNSSQSPCHTTFCHVHHLDLSHYSNVLVGTTGLPPVLQYLGQLRFLCLSDNAIIELPSQLCDWFPDLEVLDISDNELTSLVTVPLHEMKHLRVLRLRGNALDNNGLHELFGGADHRSLLTCLDLGYNELSLVPERIGNAEGLVLLSLAHITSRRCPCSYLSN